MDPASVQLRVVGLYLQQLRVDLPVVVEDREPVQRHAVDLGEKKEKIVQTVKEELPELRRLPLSLCRHSPCPGSRYHPVGPRVRTQPTTRS